MSEVKLTTAQAALLSRERHRDHGREFILLHTASDDRVARALHNKGLGTFVNHGMQYTWRPRSGYHNLFWPKEMENV